MVADLKIISWACGLKHTNLHYWLQYHISHTITEYSRAKTFAVRSPCEYRGKTFTSVSKQCPQVPKHFKIHGKIFAVQTKPRKFWPSNILYYTVIHLSAQIRKSEPGDRFECSGDQKISAQKMQPLRLDSCEKWLKMKSLIKYHNT